MEAMFTNEVYSYLQKTFPSLSLQTVLAMHFGLLIENDLDPSLRVLKRQFPSLQIGIYPSHGVLTILFKDHDPKIVEQARLHIMGQFAPYSFEAGSGKIEEAIHKWMIVNKKTLALAESCTGGLLAHALTSLPGSSGYFLGSLVTYSNTWKESLLQVKKQTLLSHGAVSREAVQEMMEGVFQLSNTDFALAVTGIAGPTGSTEQKPVGTVWVAIAERGKPPEIGLLMCRGSRLVIMETVVNKILFLLYRKVVHQVPCFSPTFSESR